MREIQASDRTRRTAQCILTTEYAHIYFPCAYIPKSKGGGRSQNPALT